MRRYFNFWLLWVLASVVGMAVFVFSPGALVLVAGNLVLGLALALPQWFVLRSRMQSASWWLLATVVGMVVGRLAANSLRSVLMANFVLGSFATRAVSSLNDA